MSTLYCSGIEKAATARMIGDEHAAGMMSQLEYSPELFQACLDAGITQLVFDSGAYSKKLSHKDIERYAGIIRATHEHVLWYAAPDCRGDQEQSNANYAYLLSLLPETLHTKILWIFQYGSDLEYLYAGLHAHQQIGVGGLAALFAHEDAAVACQRIGVLATIIEQAGVVPHYFLATRKRVIEKLCAIHQEFSVDSTTWLVGTKYGKMINARGQQIHAHTAGFSFSGEDLNGQNIRTMRPWVDSSPVSLPCTIPVITSNHYQQLAIF